LQLHEMPSPPAGEAPGTEMAHESALVRPRAELLHELSGLRELCREYRGLLARIWEDDAPNDEARRLLLRHREQAAAAQGAFAALAPAGALLEFVLDRLRQDAIAFRLSVRGLAAPEAAGDGVVSLAQHLRAVQPPLEALAARVYREAQAAPAPAGVRAQRLLDPVAALLKAVLRQDWADAELVLNHLNMVSTSRENHELVEQVGRLVRSIYTSLEQISREVPIEALSQVSEEIPDAVQKLGSVIAELEAGTNRNLDLLELLTAQVNAGREQAAAGRKALAECEATLEALAAEHPAAAAELGEVQALLAGAGAAPLERTAEHLGETHEIYMTLFANQSYQDLTGQTLKKVIAFIESLQYQLIQVISKEGAKPTLGAPTASHEHPLEAGPDAHNRLSQDKVDTMLAELGF
jgi:chemotaxis protein CheZ